MRTTTIITLALVTSGCEKKEAPKPKTADQIDPAKNPWIADAGVDAAPAAAPVGSAGSGSAGSGSAGSAATVTKPGNDVRPPVAADLAEYTKDLPGKGTKLLAKIETSKGAINCELFPDKAPMTVANFVGLATGKKAWKNPKTDNVEVGKPFFNDLTFHRVIPEFMIQGGDPLGQGTGGPGYQFGDEFVPELKMEPGTLAMANSGPSTNGSQFFITETAPDWLNGKHTIFGKCKEIDLVKQIARVPQDAQNKPDTPITMKISIKKG
jgi:peptidyl-prolyl cis-trans isomerase A (cyclophilin A)